MRYDDSSNIPENRPRARVEQSAEKVLESLTSLVFERWDVWGFSTEKWECTLDADGEGFACVRPKLDNPFRSDGEEGDRSDCGQVARQDFVNGIKELNVATWVPRYEPSSDTMVLDGDNWELTLTSPEGCFLSRGHSAYPVEFDALRDFLDEACDRSGSAGMNTER